MKLLTLSLATLITLTACSSTPKKVDLSKLESSVAKVCESLPVQKQALAMASAIVPDPQVQVGLGVASEAVKVLESVCVGLK